MCTFQICLNGRHLDTSLYLSQKILKSEVEGKKYLSVKVIFAEKIEK